MRLAMRRRKYGGVGGAELQSSPLPDFADIQGVRTTRYSPLGVFELEKGKKPKCAGGTFLFPLRQFVFLSSALTSWL